jgi:hypothetical protein
VAQVVLHIFSLNIRINFTPYSNGKHAVQMEADLELQKQGLTKQVDRDAYQAALAADAAAEKG